MFTAILTWGSFKMLISCCHLCLWCIHCYTMLRMTYVSKITMVPFWILPLWFCCCCSAVFWYTIFEIQLLPSCGQFSWPLRWIVQTLLCTLSFADVKPFEIWGRAFAIILPTQWDSCLEGFIVPSSENLPAFSTHLLGHIWISAVTFSSQS